MIPHVLVVEDDARALSVLERALGAFNAKVDVRASVPAALATLENGYELVISEMRVGGETCAPLWRELRFLQRPSALLVTGGATARLREVFGLQSLGAAAFLEKPLNEVELADALHRLLRERRSPIAAQSAVVSMKYGLTRAESEVLECLLQRMTYGEVASHRQVSRNTIKSQMRVILEKCGANSLREIARSCLQDPLVPSR